MKLIVTTEEDLINSITIAVDKAIDARLGNSQGNPEKKIIRGDANMAKVLGIGLSSMRKLRSEMRKEKNPPFSQFQRIVLYDQDRVLNYLNQRNHGK